MRPAGLCYLGQAAARHLLGHDAGGVSRTVRPRGPTATSRAGGQALHSGDYISLFHNRDLCSFLTTCCCPKLCPQALWRCYVTSLLSWVTLPVSSASSGVSSLPVAGLASGDLTIILMT